MNTKGRFWSVVCVITFLGSCSIPEVKESTKGNVTIASDFLEPKDTVLFKGFQKYTNVKIKIVNLDADSVLSHCKTEKFNAKFDVVWLSSSYSMYRLSRNNVLNPLSFEIKTLAGIHSSPKNNFVSLGLNPYVFDFGDSTAQKAIYHDLIKSTNWKTNLGEDDLVPFYASILSEFGIKKNNAGKEWIKKTIRAKSDEGLDDQNLSFEFITFLSAHNDTNTISFPNQQKNGCYYDSYCMGIVKNSKNYHFAQKLLTYFLAENHNEVITGKLHIFPLNDPKGRSLFGFHNDYPYFSKHSLNQTVPFFNRTKYMLKKIKAEQFKESESPTSN